MSDFNSESGTNQPQVNSKNESSHVEARQDEKTLLTNNKTPEKKSSKNKQVDNYDPAIHKLDGTLRDRPVPTFKWGGY